MKNTKLLAVTLFVVMAIWQPAMAGNGASAPPVHKRYVGFDVGASHATGGLFGSETTSGSTGFALRFGYQFNRHLAAEIGYAYFGDFQFDNRPAPNNCPGRPPGGCDITTKTTLSAPLINVVGLIPLGERWALKARAGVFYAHVSSEISGPGAPTSPSPSRVSDSNSGLHLGAAVTYRFNDHMDGEIGWTYFEQLGVGVDPGGDLILFGTGSSSLAAVGIAYRF